MWKVYLYIVHYISQPNVIEVVYVQPIQTEMQTTEQQLEGLPKILETLPEIPE